MKSFLSILCESKITNLKITVTKWKADESRFPDDQDTPVFLFRAYVDDKVVGYAEYYRDWNTVENVFVNKEFRRKGIATKLYDAIEKKFNIKIEPSSHLEADGLDFWKKRDPFHPNLRYK